MTKMLLMVPLLLLFSALHTSAQAPAPLPGYSIQVFAGYAGVQGQQDGNGLVTQLEVPAHTWNHAMTLTSEIGLQNFQLSTPNQNVLLGMGTLKSQFSSATFLDGQVFQPFVFFGAGASRNACVAVSNCAPGVSTRSSPAYDFGGGMDMVESNHVTWRLFQFARIQLTSGPVNIGNTNQFITGIGIHF